jgi:hypothetical protein
MSSWVYALDLVVVPVCRLGDHVEACDVRLHQLLSACANHGQDVTFVSHRRHTGVAFVSHRRHTSVAFVSNSRHTSVTFVVTP